MSTGLVGRQSELDALRSVVAGVAGGAPAAVLLTGVPGVGKTRLAREVLDAASSSGFRSVSGRAHDIGQDVAFAPLVAALGPALRDAGAAEHAALIADLPQLALLFAGLGLGEPAPLGDPALERARLFDGLSRLVDRLARERPLALLIDDVHAADPSTITFLHYLTETVTDRPTLLILTARPDEPDSEHMPALSRAMSASSWTFAQLTVAPLDTSDAAQLASAVFGKPVGEQLAAAIVERCGGRPLFIEAVARTLLENGQVTEADGVMHLSAPDVPLPDAVRDQLRIRLSRVGPDERSVLNLLAIAGGDVQFRHLAKMSPLERERLLAALDRLHGLGLLAPGTPAAHCELVHGLLRDSLLHELSPAATASGHAALAEALMDDDPQDPRAAEHVLHAGGLVMPERALRQLMRGAEHANSVGAPEDAVRYVRAAIEAANQTRQVHVVADLYRDLAEVLRRTGDNSGAAAAWEQAHARYRQLGSPTGVARVEQELGTLAWSRGDLELAGKHFAAAEQALAGLEPSPAHARLLFAKVVNASRLGDTNTVTQTARELRALAGELGSPALTARALLAEAVLDYAATDYLAMIETNLRALNAAVRSGDRLLELRAYDQLSVAAASQLDLPALRHYTECSLHIAGELGSPLLAGFPRARMGVLNLLTGEWDLALRNTAEMSALTRRFGELRGSVSASACHAWVLARRGRLADAHGYLQQARKVALPMLAADRNIFSIVAIAEVVLALAQDDPSTAVERGAQLDDASGGWMPLLGLAMLAEARVRAGDVEGARTLAGRIAGVRSCGTIAPRALSGWITGLLRTREGADCIPLFAAAVSDFETLGLPFFAARALLASATALVAGPNAASAGEPREQAITQARSALDTFERLGAPLEAQAARELLRSLGAVPSRGRARRDTGTPLSPRELEVARLVASGLTNAEVATELFVSPRTVTTHLDRIYTRLQLSSRVALTRYLADSGLLDDADG